MIIFVLFVCVIVLGESCYPTADDIECKGNDDCVNARRTERRKLDRINEFVTFNRLIYLIHDPKEKTESRFGREFVKLSKYLAFALSVEKRKSLSFGIVNSAGKVTHATVPLFHLTNDMDALAQLTALQPFYCTLCQYLSLYDLVTVQVIPDAPRAGDYRYLNSFDFSNFGEAPSCTCE